MIALTFELEGSQLSLFPLPPFARLASLPTRPIRRAASLPELCSNRESDVAARQVSATIFFAILLSFFPVKAGHLTGNDDEFLPTFFFFHGHFHMLENTEY